MKDEVLVHILVVVCLFGLGCCIYLQNTVR